MHVPTTALDLGKAQETLGLLVEARASYLEAARFPATNDESRAFKKASQEGKQLADGITPRLASLTVHAPSSAKVRIDDAEMTTSSVGASLKVNPGKHEVVAALGSEEKRQTIELAEGEVRTVTLAPAEVERPVDPVEDKPTDAAASPKTVNKTSPFVWAGGAVAIVGVGVGAVTGLLTLQHRNNALAGCFVQDGQTRCPPSTYPDIDSGHTLGTVSTVAFLVAGIGVGMFVYGLLTPSKVAAAPSAASAVSVRATPLGLSGSF